MAKIIMIQGTCSNAGKSLLCAALCRIFRQDGYRVAPFKSQNMALNSFITADGREMGRAQVVQAEAAGIAPDVRMNPILLKPTSDVGSQVIIMGEAQGNRTAREYWGHKKALLPIIKDAFDSLAAENDIIVIEGAGSPAEINLKQDDIVNMGLAKLVNAPVLLVGDIDRGGVFASLYGTVKLLEEDEQARIHGLIINKFRGDVEILRPGLTQLEDLTGKPVIGVVPYGHFDIDDEDSQRLLRLFNTPEGQAYLKNELHLDDELIEKLTWLGISGIANVLCCIKMAKYYEFTERDVVGTVLTDSAVMYGSRIQELNDQYGAYNAHEAAMDHALHMLGLKLDNMQELTYADRKRVHNLKYYTWVEQQGKTVEELNALWYDTEGTWDTVHAQAKDLDELINAFNEATGLLKDL